MTADDDTNARFRAALKQAELNQRAKHIKSAEDQIRFILLGIEAAWECHVEGVSVHVMRGCKVEIFINEGPRT